MWVLNWSECLLFVPISRRLRSCELSIVDFTDSWDFVVATAFRMVALVVFWRPRATLLKFFSNSTQGFVLEKRSSIRIFASGIFRIDSASGLVSGKFVVGQELPASPLILGLSLLFSIILFLCPVFFCGVCSLPVVWLSLPVTPGIVVETRTAEWCSPPTFLHWREMMK